MPPGPPVRAASPLNPRAPCRCGTPIKHRGGSPRSSWSFTLAYDRFGCAGQPGVHAWQHDNDRGGVIPRQEPPRRNALTWVSVFPTYLARYGAAFSRAG